MRLRRRWEDDIKIGLTVIEWKMVDLSIWLKTGTNVEILGTRK
jgi:hypothetical protein